MSEYKQKEQIGPRKEKKKKPGVKKKPITFYLHIQILLIDRFKIELG